MRPGCRRLFRCPLHRGDGSARALGLPVEPQGGWSRQCARFRRHEDRADLVRRRQDRLPYPPHAVPDLDQIPRHQASGRAFLHRPHRRGRPLSRRRRDRHRVGRVHLRGRQGGRSSRPEAPGAFSSRTPMAASSPATAWRWPTATACRCATWSSCNTIRPACRAAASCSPKPAEARVASSPTRTAIAICRITVSGRPTRGRATRRWSSGPRDRLSQAFWHEERKGRTIATRHGAAVNLDLRHLGAKKLRERLPQICELAESFLGIDPAEKPIPVRPGGPLHHGRHPGERRDRVDSGRALCGRRVLQHRHPRRQPARLQLPRRARGSSARWPARLRRVAPVRCHRGQWPRWKSRPTTWPARRRSHPQRGRRRALGRVARRDGAEHGSGLRHLSGSTRR